MLSYVTSLAAGPTTATKLAPNKTKQSLLVLSSKALAVEVELEAHGTWRLEWPARPHLEAPPPYVTKLLPFTPVRAKARISKFLKLLPSSLLIKMAMKACLGDVLNVSEQCV